VQALRQEGHLMSGERLPPYRTEDGTEIDHDCESRRMIRDVARWLGVKEDEHGLYDAPTTQRELMRVIDAADPYRYRIHELRTALDKAARFLESAANYQDRPGAMKEHEALAAELREVLVPPGVRALRDASAEPTAPEHMTDDGGSEG
jgi:hypothetical protein